MKKLLVISLILPIVLISCLAPRRVICPEDRACVISEEKHEVYVITIAPIREQL